MDPGGQVGVGEAVGVGVVVRAGVGVGVDVCVGVGEAVGVDVLVGATVGFAGGAGAWVAGGATGTAEALVIVKVTLACAIIGAGCVESWAVRYVTVVPVTAGLPLIEPSALSFMPAGNGPPV